VGVRLNERGSRIVVTTLFPRFLEDPAEYKQSEGFWVDLWGRAERYTREEFRWSHPWLENWSPPLRDGNPIFSARSLVLRRGVRVVQLEPLGPNLDFQAWLDNFGGDVTNPRSIQELVIACVLSEESARLSLGVMSQWAQGHSISLDYREGGFPVPTHALDSAGSYRRFGSAA